jgi:hypothetical protein
MENSLGVTQRINNRIVIWSSKFTPAYIAKESNLESLDICTLAFITALFPVVKRSL